MIRNWAPLPEMEGCSERNEKRSARKKTGPRIRGPVLFSHRLLTSRVGLQHVVGKAIHRGGGGVVGVQSRVVRGVESERSGFGLARRHAELEDERADLNVVAVRHDALADQALAVHERAVGAAQIAQ